MIIFCLALPKNRRWFYNRNNFWFRFSVWKRLLEIQSSLSNVDISSLEKSLALWNCKRIYVIRLSGIFMRQILIFSIDTGWLNSTKRVRFIVEKSNDRLIPIFLFLRTSCAIPSRSFRAPSRFSVQSETFLNSLNNQLCPQNNITNFIKIS